jgi:hypothetical protein
MMMEGSGSGGPKTCRSGGSGSGSATLLAAFVFLAQGARIAMLSVMLYTIGFSGPAPGPKMKHPEQEEWRS